MTLRTYATDSFTWSITIDHEMRMAMLSNAIDEEVMVPYKNFKEKAPHEEVFSFSYDKFSVTADSAYLEQLGKDIQSGKRSPAASKISIQKRADEAMRELDRTQ